MPFEFERLSIPDVILVKPKRFNDKRGFFMELYRRDLYIEGGIKTTFVQDNLSYSKKNVLRGLHFQLHPASQAKLVTCVRGSIYDVAVDLRLDSTTFGKYVSTELNDRNGYALYIPEGFAHGFLVLSEEALVLYKVSKEYSPRHEYGLIWNDPIVNIKWPTTTPILSEKDKRWPNLKELIKENKIF